jgi:hypothetical protein
MRVLAPSVAAILKTRCFPLESVWPDLSPNLSIAGLSVILQFLLFYYGCELGLRRSSYTCFINIFDIFVHFHIYSF